MELRHIRYFVALAYELHFTRAAERVHVTQSTLSHQIKKLEEELGQPLFDRVGKKVMLTEAGESFRSYAINALQELDKGTSAIKAITTKLTGEIVVATTHTFNLNLIPKCIAMFAVLHPDVKVKIKELTAEEIQNFLTSGEVDLGITYELHRDSHLHFEPLYEEEMVLIINKSHPFCQRKRVRMAELNQQRFVMLSSEFRTRSILDECFRNAGISPNVVVEMNVVSPMLDLVSEIGVAAIVAKSTPINSKNLVSVALEGPTPVRTPGLLWNRDTNHSPQVQSFASIVRKATLNYVHNYGEC